MILHTSHLPRVRRQSASYRQIIVLLISTITLATIARILFNPFLGGHLPYVTYFIAVAVSARMEGWRSATLVTVVGFPLAWYLFVPYQNSFMIEHNVFISGFAMYFMVCFAFGFLGNALLRERRRASEQAEYLATILESIGNGVIVVDTDLRITNVNPAAQSMIGVSADEVLGESLVQAIDWKDEQARRSFESLAHTALNSQKVMTSAQVTSLVTQSGETIVIKQNAAPIRSHSGNITGCVLVLHDMTEEHRLQIENTQKTLAAERLANDLEKADHRKDEFLAMLAHELRNPLASVRTAADILRLSGHTDETVAATSSTVERQIRHLSLLIDDLLDVSRITQGKIQLRKAPVEIAEMIEIGLDIARPLLEKCQHTLQVDAPCKSIYLNADRLRVAQIIGNLLHNACKFTSDHGDIHLTIQYDEAILTIIVRDNGIGLAPENLNDIFEMFVQIDTSISRTSNGSGIGLTVVRNLANLHGGSVHAHSKGLGYGSTFTVSLPLERVDPPAEPAMPLPSVKSCRVLVVDDNENNATMMKALLEMENIVVDLAFDGLSAFHKALEFVPDVILLDLGLPKLNGYQVCERLRAEPCGANIFIIALTGWGQESSRQRTQQIGFDDHLVKPVGHREIMEAIAKGVALVHERRVGSGAEGEFPISCDTVQIHMHASMQSKAEYHA
ncbi:MAG: ATP-binding protein [Nitrospirales bacterium]|nr:response regulator [Nitrospira sp.]MDR4502720.1 ATP-binding protein [Nitrospirales bacterium]